MKPSLSHLPDLKPVCQLAWACLLLLLALPSAASGIRDAPGSQLEVALLTYGPGEVYWERFGHDAIEITDRESGESVSFNYGMFDFEQENFLLNFARGRMLYRMDAVATADDLDWYRHEGRSIERQQLALTAEQKNRLRDELLWNVQPENAQYRYNYYTANCATQVRDVLDRVLDGAIRKQTATRHGDLSWRQQTDRLMAAQPWLMLGMDLGLSGYADQPLNAWQESFLPMVLARELDHIELTGADGARYPLVISSTVLAPSRLSDPPAHAPDLRLPLLLAGATFAFLLLTAGRSHRPWVRRLAATLASLWLGIAGLVGLVLLLLWIGTEHRAAWANANLLLFNPLAWLLLPAVWRDRSTASDHLLAWLLVLLAAAGLMANVTGLIAQQNLPWILLAMPVWLVLAQQIRARTIGVRHD